MHSVQSGIARYAPLLAGLLIVLPLVLPAGGAFAQEYEETVFRDASFFLEIFGLFADTVFVSGPTELLWTDRYFNGITDVIDMQMTGIRLHGECEPLGCVSIVPHASEVSWGRAMFSAPGGDWPAESFFDIYLQVLIPAHPPFDTLHTTAPIHLVSPIHQMPPFFSQYEMTPPAPVPLFNGEGLVVGEISLLWQEEMIPWSAPSAHISALTSHNSDIAIVRENAATFTAGVAGWVEPAAGIPQCVTMVPMSATFGIRPESSPAPFSTFYVDPDGSGKEIGTVAEMRVGDGWAGYLDVSGFPPQGQRFDVEVIFDFGTMDLRDTTTVFLSSAPPVPEFIGYHPDSIGFFKVDTSQSVVVAVPAPQLASIALQVNLLSPVFQRALEVVEQDSLSKSRSIAAVACVPAAAASCLKYWAKNGYPGLEHPRGDTTKPPGTGTQMGKALLKDIDPKPSKDGAQVEGAVEGINKYLTRHGCTGWRVSQHEIKDKAGLAEMERELETENEDVIMIVSDTTRIKGRLTRTGHAVTLGSRHAAVYTEEKDGKKTLQTPQKLDFMDPRDGTTPAQNVFPVGTDGEGYPTTDNYTHTGGMSSARISGYIKVSPPEPSGGSSSRSSDRSGRRVPAIGRMDERAAPSEAGEWVVVDAAPGRGNGLPDTLTWNTEGFPGGLYLLEVTARDFYGNIGKALRFAAIPEYNVVVGVSTTPPSQTHIAGVYPNPFNASMRIRYAIASRAKVSLVVHDASGRLVATLIDGAVKGPGVYDMAWNGMNARGRKVASGVYFCRLTAGSSVETRKIVLVR